MLALLLTLLLPLALAGKPEKLDTLYSWKTADYTFHSKAERQTYLTKGKFIPKNNVILDVDVWESDKNGAGRKVFVTIPKLSAGVPVTLATVGQKKGSTNLLEPYPSWSWHKGSCKGITSVFRTHVDKCGRLWVIDCGTENNVQKCPPQILVFNLHNDRLIRRHRFPTKVLGSKNLLNNIIVDSRTKDCSDSVAYISDVQGYKLLVYDYPSDKSWKVENKLFSYDARNDNFTIDGVNFTLTDGVFGMALGPVKNHDRPLYFHSFASVHENVVSTSLIRNSALFEKNPAASPKAFHTFPHPRSSQSASEDMTDNGVLLYSLMNENAIGCWNSQLPFKKKNLDIVAKNDVTLQFISGLKIYNNQIWTLSSRFQNFIIDKIPTKEINYRINVGRVSDLVRNTKCDVKKTKKGSKIPPQKQKGKKKH